MKVLYVIAVSILSGMLSAGPISDDSGRRADILDSKGVTTHVTGLHYCYEEAEGEEVFINKYDDFFVRRGEALIRVRLDSLVLVEFTGKIEQAGEDRLLEARIKTRAGSETLASILCHPGGFIKGHVDLGEFQIPLEHVKKMVFPAQIEPASPLLSSHPLGCHFPGPVGGIPEGTLHLRVDSEGRFFRMQRSRHIPFDSAVAEVPEKVLLSLGPDSNLEPLRKALEQLWHRGARDVVFVR